MEPSRPLTTMKNLEHNLAKATRQPIRLGTYSVKDSRV